MYFWQGRNCTKRDRGQATMVLKEVVSIVQQRGGEPVQKRIVEGKEPRHFRLIFKDQMVIHSGRRDQYSGSTPALFQVRGWDENSTIASQVPIQINSFSSLDAFVYIKDVASAPQLWIGRSVQPYIAASAISLCAGLTSPALRPVVLQETDTSLSFWKLIDERVTEVGSDSYACHNSLHKLKHTARLFAFSMTSGTLTAEEIYDYSQDDLVENEHVMLDAINEVYLWFLPSVSQENQDAAHALATEYVKTSFDGRLQTTPIYSLPAGSETLNFCAHFHAWQGEKQLSAVPKTPRVARPPAAGAGRGIALPGLGAGFRMPSITGRAAFGLPAAGDKPLVALKPSGTSGASSTPKTYTLAELTGPARPKGLDESKLEAYLDHAEFETIFNTTPDAFAKLPIWVRTSQKKKVGL